VIKGNFADQKFDLGLKGFYTCNTLVTIPCYLCISSPSPFDCVHFRNTFNLLNWLNLYTQASTYSMAAQPETFAKLAFFLGNCLRDWCLVVLRHYTCTCYSSEEVHTV